MVDTFFLHQLILLDAFYPWQYWLLPDRDPPLGNEVRGTSVGITMRKCWAAFLAVVGVSLRCALTAHHGTQPIGEVRA